MEIVEDKHNTTLTHSSMRSPPDGIDSMMDLILSSIRTHLPSTAVMTFQKHSTTDGGWGPGSFVELSTPSPTKVAESCASLPRKILGLT